eukprot:7161410-Ditylum_brightwellii.AAC.1
MTTKNETIVVKGLFIHTFCSVLFWRSRTTWLLPPPPANVRPPICKIAPVIFLVTIDVAWQLSQRWAVPTRMLRYLHRSCHLILLDAFYFRTFGAYAYAYLTGLE